MCTLVLLRRPDHAWPLILAANRDEMSERRWQPPARHWLDRPKIIAGRDDLGGGTWLGLNDAGVLAGVLNRINSLGSSPGLHSRGILPLQALAHPEAASAAKLLTGLNPSAFRPFNLVVADWAEAYWIRAIAEDGGRTATSVTMVPVPPGLSMFTAYDRNDQTSPRIRHFLGRFEDASVPDPERGDWDEWVDLLSARSGEPTAGRGGAMTIITESGFGTVSSSLLALPRPDQRKGARRRPIWLFAAGRPGEAAFRPVRL